MTLAALLRHLAFAAALALLSAGVVRVMIAVRVMDTPDAAQGARPATPRAAGSGSWWRSWSASPCCTGSPSLPAWQTLISSGVIEASVAIAVVAFLDDLFDWKFTVKLAAQVLAALVAVGSGIYVHGLPAALRRAVLYRLGWERRRPWYGCCSPPMR